MRSLNTPASSTCEGRESRFGHCNATIAVGISNQRAKLRVSILLNTMPEYQIRNITSEEEMTVIIEESDLVIGAGAVAREGILYKKPVIVIGDYGNGGLITPHTMRAQYNDGFRGRILGMKDEYFSLAILEEEIKKSADLTFQELQMMSNHLVTFLHNIDF